VQDTLNNVKIAEIEKRMVQLANSFNASSSSPTNLSDQMNNSNSPKKVCLYISKKRSLSLIQKR
jgi:hypothetical protein